MALLASCAKEEKAPVSVDNGTPFILEVGIPSAASKTSLGAKDANDQYPVYWSDGDKIQVNDKTSNALENVAASSTLASFTFANDPGTPCNILYPASFYKDATHVTLPAVQTYKAGGFADGMFPMAGYSADGSSLLMSYLCALVKVSIKQASGEGADTDKIVSVKFVGKNNEQVSGEFSIDYQNCLISGASSADADKSVKVVKPLATSTSAAIDYYLVVPAGTYSNGFYIVVQDEKGDIQTKEKVSSATLNAGTLYNLDVFTFVPNGKATGIEISSAAELVAFAQAYNAGDYVGQEDLVVTLTANIDFSEGPANTSFAATGGIGTKSGEAGTTADNYFLGVFEGNNHTISNYKANVPLFKYTRTATTIRNFTMDNTCELTFTHANAAEGDFGAVVGYHKGTLQNVTVNSDVALAAASSITQHAVLGGIVGNLNNGTIIDCIYAGNISVPSGFEITATNKKILIGGIAGYISNASGKIQGSDFNGTICNEGHVAKGNDTTPLLLIGGIVGYGNGTVSDCETTDHPTANSAYTADAGTTYLQGTIVNKTVQAYHSSVGGIIGENLSGGTVSGCTNKATIVSTLFKDGNSDDKGHILRLGGVAGTNRGTISGCDNEAAMTSRSNPYYQYYGGVVGWNVGSVSDGTNSGALAISTAGVGTYGPRYGYFGGVIGLNTTGATVSDVHNASTGAMTLSRAENNASTYVHMGGVFGSTDVAIDGGSTKNITNAAQVLYNSAISSSTGFDIGGIVGSATAAVKNVNNSGIVQLDWTSVVNKTFNLAFGGVVGRSSASIEDVENSGQLYFRSTKASTLSDVDMGGIVGNTSSDVRGATNAGYVVFYHSGATVASNISLGGVVGKLSGNGTLKDCLNKTTAAANSGEVNFQVTAAAAHVNDYFGGILGYSSADVTIDNCDNQGYVHTNQNITITDSNWYLGGVVGYLAGDSSITGCDNTGYTKINAGNNTDTPLEKIFADGGIAGVVQGTSEKHITISDCTWNYTSTDVGSRRGTCGGIVAYAEYADISDCDVTVTYNMQYHVAGGIVGWAVNSTISGCRFMGSKINSTQGLWEGGIVAKLTSGSVVNGCYNYCATITSDKTTVAKGEIAGISETGTKIKNSHHTGNISICSDSNFTDDGEPNDTNLPPLS